MQRLILDKDIKPLSEFRANTAGFIKQVQQTKRPLVITSRGKSAAILMDVSEYEALIEQIDLLQDIKVAERQIEAGKGIAHVEARKRLLQRLAR